jgi:regulator of protease activity HflC (stomatin/prohibitin superfamily)
MVIFRLGKCVGTNSPGLILTLPIDRPITVDLRVRHQEVPHEACITQDNVQIYLDFVLYWKIQQPVWSITKVTDPEESIKLLATALLRAVIAHFLFK